MKSVRLITALRAGSLAAQISFIEHADASQKAASDLLRDILAAQYHGTRQQTCIISAMEGTREESDLALIKQMAALSESREALAAWINKFTYPGEEKPDRMLHIACSRGFEQIVRYLVKNGANINLEDGLGETPLLHACRAGRTQVAKFLLLKRASVRACGPCAETPLHWLCSFPTEHVTEIADLLVKAGSDFSAMAKHRAARGDSMEQQQFSFAAGTPLHRAVSRQAYKAVDCLLQLGASPTLKSSFAPFYSPLSLACSMNLSMDSSAPQTRILNPGAPGLQSGKDSRRRLVAGQIHVGSLREHQYTSSNCASETSILKRLLEACTQEDMNRLHCQPYEARRLLEIALDIDPLLRISVHGENWRLASRHTVRLLWLFGEDLVDRQVGFSSLHLACDAGNFEAVDEITRLLPKSSLNATMPGRSVFIQTPLHYAVRGGHERIVKLLLEKGADPTQRFMTDWIYTGAAPTSGTWSLLESDDLDRSKMAGLRSTLLHTCASVGSESKIVKDLIRRGVKVNSYDSNWQSPLYLAIRACNFEVADVLLEHGARLNELRDDLTIFGQLAEDGFSSPVGSFEYILNKLKPKDSAAFMADFKQSLTVFHKLMESEGSQRNLAWSEQLFLVFLRFVPDKRILDVQADGTADTALHVAVRKNNLLGVRLLLDAGANPNLPNCSDGTPFDLANKLRPELLTEFPEEIMDDPHAVAEYELRRGTIVRTISEKGGKWLRDPAKTFASRLFANMETIGPDLVEALGEEKYSMPRWAENTWFKLRVELSVDLKTVNAKETYYEGAIREIVEDIVAGLQPLFLNQPAEFLRNPQGAVTKVLGEHLSKTPEIFHRRLRVFRFESQMAWALSGFSGFSLSFNPKDMSVTMGVPLEDDGSGGVGTPNFVKRRGGSYEQSTKGTRMIAFPRGVGGGPSFTTAVEDGEDSIEEILAGEYST
jgi:ankyrin repeat protein